ncbi:hypothetical protein JOB18_049659 [Solea senegalensis]|uniref:Uncharacterized protein n=1 Tax=Solea senegalensis TaxID=28829 RepID=A0AAV6RWX5_SOLSE|nr:hypothetical protein JOB18_049659 [Solea senegalensis]
MTLVSGEQLKSLCLTSAQQFLLSAFKKSSRMLCPTTTRDMSPPKANKTVTALSPHKTKRKREGQHGHQHWSTAAAVLL